MVALVGYDALVQVIGRRWHGVLRAALDGDNADNSSESDDSDEADGASMPGQSSQSSLLSASHRSLKRVETSGNFYHSPSHPIGVRRGRRRSWFSAARDRALQPLRDNVFGRVDGHGGGGPVGAGASHHVDTPSTGTELELRPVADFSSVKQHREAFQRRGAASPDGGAGQPPAPPQLPREPTAPLSSMAAPPAPAGTHVAPQPATLAGTHQLGHVRELLGRLSLPFHALVFAEREFGVGIVGSASDDQPAPVSTDVHGDIAQAAVASGAVSTPLPASSFGNKTPTPHAAEPGVVEAEESKGVVDAPRPHVAPRADPATPSDVGDVAPPTPVPAAHAPLAATPLNATPGPTSHPDRLGARKNARGHGTRGTEWLLGSGLVGYQRPEDLRARLPRGSEVIADTAATRPFSGSSFMADVCEPNSDDGVVVPGSALSVSYVGVMWCCRLLRESPSRRVATGTLSPPTRVLCVPWLVAAPTKVCLLRVEWTGC